VTCGVCGRLSTTALLAGGTHHTTSAPCRPAGSTSTATAPRVLGPRAGVRTRPPVPGRGRQAARPAVRRPDRDLPRHPISVHGVADGVPDGRRDVLGDVPRAATGLRLAGEAQGIRPPRGWRSRLGWSSNPRLHGSAGPARRRSVGRTPTCAAARGHPRSRASTRENPEDAFEGLR
jgi:hypothetical protein